MSGFAGGVCTCPIPWGYRCPVHGPHEKATAKTIVADLLAARKLEAAYGVESTPPVRHAEERLLEVVRAAVLAEREACAKLADAESVKVREEEFFGAREGTESLRGVAAAIRARPTPAA